MSDYYKVTTHDLRPPIRGGEPIWDGEVPYTLPEVEVDTGPEECAAGWNACREPHTALRIAGLWPRGRPSRLWRVRQNGHPIIERGDKIRSATWEVVEEAEVTDAILADLHRPMAVEGLPLDDLVAEVQAWRVALSRPRRDEDAVRAGLQAALDARGLEWNLRRYDTARAARAARDVWVARGAWGAWGAWVARGARVGTGARDALTVYVAAKRGWTDHDPHLLTTGLRDAYGAGLAVAVPVEDGVLGYAMEPEDGARAEQGGEGE